MNITDQVLLVLALALHFAVITGAAFVMVCWWFARPRIRSSEKIAIAADDYLMQFNARALKQIGADMHQERQTRGITQRYHFLRDVSGLLAQRLINTR